MFALYCSIDFINGMFTLTRNVLVYKSPTRPKNQRNPLILGFYIFRKYSKYSNTWDSKDIFHNSYWQDTSMAFNKYIRISDTYLFFCVLHKSERNKAKAEIQFQGASQSWRLFPKYLKQFACKRLNLMSL